MSIEKDIIEIVEEQLGVSDVTKESTFADLGADSLDLVELAMALEEDYELEIPDDDAETFVTVQDVIEYIVDRT